MILLYTIYYSMSTLLSNLSYLEALYPQMRPFLPSLWINLEYPVELKMPVNFMWVVIRVGNEADGPWAPGQYGGR